ncbi:MAG: hypothetical protein ACRD4Y_07610, partial [Candidatus Acidiferrales bacterium]
MGGKAIGARQYNRKIALAEIERSILFIFIFLIPASVRLRAQSDTTSNHPKDVQQPSSSQASQPPASPTGKAKVPKSGKASDTEHKQDNSQGKQTKRMFWVVPNFGAVNANAQLPPLSVRGKFALASRDSVVDYSAYTWTAILAGQAMLLNSDPELGRGAAGYGRYYWRNFVDGVSGTFFTEAIVPAISREDPRYYTLGEGGFFRRTAYAISRAFVCKSDSGRTVFN